MRIIRASRPLSRPLGLPSGSGRAWPGRAGLGLARPGWLAQPRRRPLWPVIGHGTLNLTLTQSQQNYEFRVASSANLGGASL